MAEKKTTTKKTTTKKKEITLVYNGTKYELTRDEFLPLDMIENKLRDGQSYVPIWVLRDIMRQIGEFGEVKFSNPEVIIEAKVGNDVKRLYKVECMVEWKQKDLVLRGSGYHAISMRAMLSDAAHGNFKTLEAKALRDALKYAYRIFEFPQDVEEIYQDEIIDKQINNVEAVINDVVDIVKSEEKKEEKNEDKKEDKKEEKENPDDLKGAEVFEDVKEKKENKKSEEKVDKKESGRYNELEEKIMKSKFKDELSNLKDKIEEEKYYSIFNDMIEFVKGKSMQWVISNISSYYDEHKDFGDAEKELVKLIIKFYFNN